MKKINEIIYGYIQNLCDVNGLMFFIRNNTEVWKSDGTTPGTVLVTNLAQTENVYIVWYLVSENGLLFFSAYSSRGTQLYRSDGIESGTFLLNGINPGSSAATEFGASNGKLYFAANDGSGYKLWVTDGTTLGTTYPPGNNNVLLQSPGGTNSFFTIENGILYFSGYQSSTGWELYKYDPNSNEGITLVKDITPNGNSDYIYPGNITVFNGSIYFIYSANNISHLYKTNGSANSTILIKDFSPGEGVGGLYAANGKLYFGVSNALGYEPWVSDGTANGTHLLSDIFPGAISSNPDHFTSINNKLLFTATPTEIIGNELFVTDGSKVEMVKEINKTTTGGSYYGYLIPYADGILSKAYTYSKGVEVLKSTSSNEDYVEDILPGQESGAWGNFKIKNNLAYFAGNTNTGSAIYKTNGTKEGTVQFSFYGDVASDFTVTDNGLVFYISHNTITKKLELRVTDGTISGDKFLHFFADISEHIFTSIGNTAYFSADDDSNPYYGTELWKSDGTVSGTKMVKDIYVAGGYGSNPRSLTAYHNTLFFSADDGAGSALWKSDGTEAGTVKIKSVYPTSLVVSNNTLFFNGTDNTSGSELWKTDDTTDGTVLLKDIVPGSGYSSPVNLTDVSGTLYFQADSAQHIQLWKSNGKSLGTQLVKTLSTTDNINLNYFTSSANQLYFLFNNKLWVSNGTASGTGLVGDDVLNDLTINDLTANGNELFLDGYNYKYGDEIYAGNAMEVVLPVTLLSFNAQLKNNDVVTDWKTVSEINTAYFNVQRSIDGVNFSFAGKTLAKGNSNTLQSYSLIDVNIANMVKAKTVYYRLEQVDKNGDTSLSKIVAVDLRLKDANMLIHPNPVKNALNIRINNFSGIVGIRLYNADGKLLRTLQKNIQSGSDISLNASGLQAGVYVIETNVNGKIIRQKFVKE